MKDLRLGAGFGTDSRQRSRSANLCSIGGLGCCASYLEGWGT